VVAVRGIGSFPQGKHALRLLALAIAYFVLAKSGLALASLHPSASPVWPPSGLAVAACLLWGSKVWPAVAAGAFLANVTTFGSVLSSLAIAVGNTLEAVVTAWLVDKWTSRAEPFETPSRVATFAALAIGPGSMISATIGVASLALAGHAEPSGLANIWVTWWLGDIGGQLLVAPVIVLWARQEINAIGRSDLQRMAVLLVLTVGVGLLAFSPLIEQTAARGSLAFSAVVPLLWAALRHDQRDTATTALVLSAFAIWGTLANGGPFARPSLNDSFLLVMTFVISAAVPSLVLSADVAVRKASEARQAVLIRELQHRTKNMLAVIQSITSNTFRHSRDLESAHEALIGRLHALAHAQDFVVHGRSSGLPLRDLVEAELSPFGARAVTTGEPLVVGGAFAQSFALIVHELATNAVKHGALAAEGGRVALDWRIDRSSGPAVLKFTWTERGGPPAKAPEKHGLGTQLMSLVGESTVAFLEEGIEYSLRVPLEEAVRGSE
jgi:two-component sensor histidine kinase